MRYWHVDYYHYEVILIRSLDILRARFADASIDLIIGLINCLTVTIAYLARSLLSATAHRPHVDEFCITVAEIAGRSVYRKVDLRNGISVSKDSNDSCLRMENQFCYYAQMVS